jgi:hypothetical protein
MKKYLITVIDPKRKPGAVTVVYNGRDWDKARIAVEKARVEYRGLKLRIVISKNRQVESIRDTLIV